MLTVSRACTYSNPTIIYRDIFPLDTIDSLCEVTSSKNLYCKASYHHAKRLFHENHFFHCFTVSFVPCMLLNTPLGNRTKKKKTSLRIHLEALRLPCRKHEERRTHYAFSSAMCRPTKFLRFSRYDRFAAQIVYATGRCPPMVRLVSCCGSFHFSYKASNLHATA